MAKSKYTANDFSYLPIEERETAADLVNNGSGVAASVTANKGTNWRVPVIKRGSPQENTLKDLAKLLAQRHR